MAAPAEQLLMHNYSPLRYPGGKARLAWYVAELVRLNALDGGEYVEPYAGGASVALALLFSGVVERVHINDSDENIHAFWQSVLDRTDELCALVRSAELTVPEWKRQREVYRSDTTDVLARGFATFFLNRTNRSGIIGNGGVIGGQAQTGTWTMGARYPTEELVRRIRKVAQHRSKIELTNRDACELLVDLGPKLPAKALVYLDPPYYVKGRGLYRNAYKPEDHAAVADTVRQLPVPWVVSYDDRPEVRSMYAAYETLAYALGYTAKRARETGREVMFFRTGLCLPSTLSPIRARPASRVVGVEQTELPLDP